MQPENQVGIIIVFGTIGFAAVFAIYLRWQTIRHKFGVDSTVRADNTRVTSNDADAKLFAEIARSRPRHWNRLDDSIFQIALADSRSVRIGMEEDATTGESRVWITLDDKRMDSVWDPSKMYDEIASYWRKVDSETS